MSQPFSPRRWRCWIRLSIWRVRISQRTGVGSTNSSTAARRFRSTLSRHGSRAGIRPKNCPVHLQTRLDDRFFARRALADVDRLRTFLDQANPGAARRAMAAILTAIERLQEFPDLGMATADADIRQIVIQFRASGYIVRYPALAETGDILVTRIWRGREARI